MRRGLLVAPADLARVREHLGRKPFDHILDALNRRCAAILSSQPVTEQLWRSAQQQGHWIAATNAVQTIQGRILDLVISHQLDRNLAYRDRAIEELKNLIGFSTWTDPCHADQIADVCTAEASATAALGLDLLADNLTEPDRIRCLKAIREKGLRPYLKAIDAGAQWYSCYHAWNAVVNCGCGIAGLMLSDDETIGATVVARAKTGLKTFFNALGREGGWDEGLGYWGYAMRYVALFGEAMARQLQDRTIFRQRGMDATGLFPIYFSPHGTAMSFGDKPTLPAWGTFYLMVKHYGLKEMCWWLDRYAFRKPVSAAGYSDAGLALVFRPTDWESNPAPDLTPLKAFNEIGWASLADRWPMPHIYVSIKTGDLSAHHAQLDMNSLQAMIGGEVMLHDPGSPDYSRDYLNPESRFNFYETQSHAHNTVTAHQRQHRLDAVGSIVEAQDAGDYRWIAADAGTALGEDVHFVRHVLMPLANTRPAQAMIVVDEIHNATPERLDLTWHSAAAITPGPGATTGLMEGKASRVQYLLAGTTDFKTALSQRPLSDGRMDNVITLTTPATSDIVLVSVFTCKPISKVSAKRISRGDVKMQIGAMHLHWCHSRRYLHLDDLHGQL